MYRPRFIENNVDQSPTGATLGQPLYSLLLATWQTIYDKQKLSSIRFFFSFLAILTLWLNLVTIRKGQSEPAAEVNSPQRIIKGKLS